MNGEPIVRIRCLPRGLVALAGVLSLISIAGPRSASADPVSELASFSIFDKVDLAQLAKSDVKTAHGPPMRNSRFLAVQSCYVVPGSPAQQIEALRRWNPANYRELIILRHSQDLSYEEIVEVTGLPLGTVKNRLFRAREMMRQQFVDKGITGI